MPSHELHGKRRTDRQVVSRTSPRPAASDTRNNPMAKIHRIASPHDPPPDTVNHSSLIWGIPRFQEKARCSSGSPLQSSSGTGIGGSVYHSTRAREITPLSSDHFSVEGILIEAWATGAYMRAAGGFNWDISTLGQIQPPQSRFNFKASAFRDAPEPGKSQPSTPFAALPVSLGPTPMTTGHSRATGATAGHCR
jgi:hypothetical protein